MFGSRNRYASSLGSGVIVSADGYVVTNNHVRRRGHDRRGHRRARRQARAAGQDRRRRPVDRSRAAEGRRDAACRSMPWGDSSRLKVAEWVMAIGNPLSAEPDGHAGHRQRAGPQPTSASPPTRTSSRPTPRSIPGNSGGALVNARGELIGINTAIFTQSGGYQGIGFAVPSNLARRIVDDLKKYGEVRRGSIGYPRGLAAHDAPGRGAARARHRRRGHHADAARLRRLRGRPAAGRHHPHGERPGDRQPSQFVRLIADSPIGSTVTIEVHARRAGRRPCAVTVERQQQRARQRRGR